MPQEPFFLNKWPVLCPTPKIVILMYIKYLLNNELHKIDEIFMTQQEIN